MCEKFTLKYVFKRQLVCKFGIVDRISIDILPLYIFYVLHKFTYNFSSQMFFCSEIIFLCSDISDRRSLDFLILRKPRLV